MIPQDEGSWWCGNIANIVVAMQLARPVSRISLYLTYVYLHRSTYLSIYLRVCRTVCIYIYYVLINAKHDVGGFPSHLEVNMLY